MSNAQTALSDWSGMICSETCVVTVAVVVEVVAGWRS